MQGEKPAQTVTRQRSLKLLVDEMLANPNMVPYQVSYPSPTQPYVGVVALDVGTGRINVLGKWRH